MRRRWMAAAGVVTMLSLGGWAGTAHGATITLQGTQWVFTGGSEFNSVLVTFEGSTLIKFADTAASITYPSGPCSETPGGWVACPYESGQSLRAELGGGDDSFSLSDSPANLAVSVDGGDGDDQIQDDFDGTALRTFSGGAGRDEIRGHNGPDIIDGGPGNDKLDGGAGADQVLGGEGDDELSGDKYEDPAPDVIDGGPGFDSLDEWSQPTESVNPFVSVTQDGVANDGRPGEGDNVTSIEKITAHSAGHYEGTAGNDEIWVWANVGTGASTIRGLGGNDKITGLDQSETIDGGPGDDVLQGGFGDDDITGGPGRDQILGDGGSNCDLYGCTVPFGNDIIRARDGEVDSIDCGLGTDTAIVDDIDVVAPTCENVQRGGGGDDPSALTLKAPASQSMRALIRRGMNVSVACPGACRIAATLKHRRRTIASGRRTLLADGTTRVTLKVARKARRVARRLRRGKLTLTVTATDSAGARTSARRSIRIKR